MRIATWNVNSLKARLEKLTWWLDRARPDVLLLQETKLADGAVGKQREALQQLGYELAHHGEGRWNGVAIASRCGIADLVTNFGDLFAVTPATARDESALADTPRDEARMMAAVCGGVRVINVYAPNGRAVGTPYFTAKLAWYRRLVTWVELAFRRNEAIVVGGDFNVAPDDSDVWNPAACHGGTHVTPDERAAFAQLCALGLVDAYRAHHREPERFTWWDYRSGDFHKNIGMRIDHFLVSQVVAERLVAAEIDREARKGPPIPSDHAPLTIDLDEPGHPFDAGWEGMAARRAARSRRSA